ncbi:MAG: hypothetical protein QW035_03490 [Candidatus Anstonellales archaeon]
MSQLELNLQNASCESCIEILKKVAQENGAQVVEIDIKTGKVLFSVEEDKIAGLRRALAENGYLEKGSEERRGDPHRVFEYIKRTLSGKLVVEAKLINYALFSAIVLLVLVLVVYYTLGTTIKVYFPLILLSIATGVVTTYSMSLVECYKRNLSCMNGMMIGMTIGMVVGFMSGATIGATNGMFVGSLVGASLGIGFGIMAGRYCGIMGVMEGIMAGLMAGTMGAMLSAMLINDNLLVSLYLLAAVCMVVIGGLSYVMYREQGEVKIGDFNTTLLGFFINSLLLSSFLTGLIIYGPRAGLVYGVLV